LGLLSVFVDTASAQQIAPYGLQTTSEYRALPVYYNYNRANDRRMAYLDKLRVFLAIREQNALAKENSLVAEVHLTDLSNSSKFKRRFYEISNDGEPLAGYKNLAFDITNVGEKVTVIEPAKVYRLFVNLHRKSEKYDEKSLIGRVPLPYYAATSGASTLDLARQQIVMRTFKEFYYINRGWDSGENYAMDCYAYYMWATGFCTKGASGGQTQLGYLFPNGAGNHSGGHVPSLAKKGAIHGDYVRIPGHSLMLLSYDPKQQIAWTMEGNFNSTVEVAIRSIDYGWSVGHLREEHVRAELFPRQKPNVPSMMAAETMTASEAMGKK
jgi:hypothetical protein